MNLATILTAGLGDFVRSVAAPTLRRTIFELRWAIVDIVVSIMYRVSTEITIHGGDRASRLESFAPQ
jgi:hypothetical protein